MEQKTNYVTSKGCMDYYGQTYNQLINYKNILENIFTLNGGIPLETPVFENKSVLMNKYGEEADTKLVFNLMDEGGEPLTLRYDHTVPFVRFIKENGIQKIRRYSIGKVYRRDQPQLSKGRLREFYQADFDILGESNSSMLPELTLLNMINQFMIKINQSNYTIYLNHTDNLKWILCEQLGLDIINFKKVCSLIDKVDFDREETFIESFRMIIPELSKYFTDHQIILLQDFIRSKNPLDKKVENNFNSLLKYSHIFGFSDKIKFNSCLARGLDYYNGFIFEVKLTGISNTIIAGGRYDNMIESNTLIGVSFGISRILQLLNQNDNIKKWKSDVYVTSLGKISIETKLNIISKLPEILSNNSIQFSSILYDTDEKSKKLTPVITECVTNYYKYLIVIAENELANNQIIVKDLEQKTQTNISIGL
jgi:histidyl-tRNA synthetase